LSEAVLRARAVALGARALRELIWLAGLGLVFGALARLATRRLLA
jgi:hypothetical protein